MYGPNVFAVLIAHDQKNKAGSAFALKYNSGWFCKATGGVALEPTTDSREITPAEDSQSDDDYELNAPTRLVLPFDKLLSLDNLQNGLQLGTNTTTSHILLGYRGTRGISDKQVS